ncbi:hypothetical protein LJC36_00175 [Desulfovibrio sp. OttesenSCG-928-C14]|nr:hypothetical protein [Desulfovibrio sp. OttesenSCG-928-C14]
MTTETWELIRDLTPLLALVASPLFVWIMWSLSQKYQRRDKCDAHRKDFETSMDDNEQRRRALEQTIKDLPDSLEAIKTNIHAMNASVRVLEEALKGQKALLERLEGRVDRMDTFLRTSAN